MSTTQTRAARRTPAQRRAQILDAARDLALAEGLSALTLRAVAARVGVTPALVAHYVPSMDDLVATTFAGIVGAELAELSAAHGLRDPARPTLGDCWRHCSTATRDDVTLVWVEAFALGATQRRARRRRPRRRWTNGTAPCANSSTAGVDEGVFRVESAPDAAWQLLGMIDGLNAHSLVRWGGAADRSSLAARAVEGMLGMRPGGLDHPLPEMETP